MRTLSFDDACGIKRQHHCLTNDGTKPSDLHLVSGYRCIPVCVSDCIPDLRRSLRTNWRASEDCARAASIEGVISAAFYSFLQDPRH